MSRMKFQKIFCLTKTGSLTITPESNGSSLTIEQERIKKILKKLRNRVSADEIYPAFTCLEFQDIARFALTGDRHGRIKKGKLSSLQPDILLAGEDFGCGSAREHAVMTLKQSGIRLIIASSFNSVFRNNCTNLGIYTTTDLEAASRLVGFGKIEKKFLVSQYQPVESK